jgi:hypothetical protein
VSKKLRVQGNHSPAGAFEGQRPSRFGFSNAPARTQHRPKKFTFALIVAVPPILAGAFGGKGGSAPDHRENAKIGAPKLAFASAKPTLSSENQNLEGRCSSTVMVVATTMTVEVFM